MDTAQWLQTVTDTARSIRQWSQTEANAVRDILTERYPDRTFTIAYLFMGAYGVIVAPQYEWSETKVIMNDTDYQTFIG